MATPFGVLSTPFSGSVDGTVDTIPFWQNSSSDAFSITRNKFLNIASQPVGLTDTQSPTNKTFDNTNAITVKDGSFTLNNTSDTTKVGVFSLASVTTGTTRTYTLPNASVTLASLTGTETLTNKTITSPAITGGTLDNATVTVDSVAGHTTSNTGTIYGISVTTGTIGSAALANNSVVTAAINTNAVTASKLDTGAIYLGSAAVTSNFSTASTTVVQITGMTATVTIPAGGRKTKITAFLPDSNGAAALTATISIWDGTVGVGTQLAASKITATLAGDHTSTTVVAVASPSAGSKTYNVGVLVDTSTVTLAMSATIPGLILVEAI